MLVEHFFDFEGANAVARTFDQVIGTAHEPEESILVAGGGIAGVVDSAFEDFFGAFCVAVIAAEHAEGLAFVNLDNDFADFIGAAALAVGIHDVHAVTGGGFAHGTGAGFHPFEVAGREREFSLAVTFVQTESCLFEEFLVNVQVQGFACGGAVLEAGKVVFSTPCCKM